MSDDTIGTGQPGQDAFTPVEELSYEQARDELIETVKILELGQMGLDESLKYWEARRGPCPCVRGAPRRRGEACGRRAR